ncbi:uracil-DNA glycosylase [Lutibaculum baratangense]|uniref:Type-4 uracil-DNA glycosylase n=1 Tax=Lutibaculum baratangense AMV1 TaxID=631454 RepID=V4RF65_9HYPH|nr:uracil-DNA glycosylase [Lutibaculum baratangense]ESR24786.1 Uracil-DNA glycosylase, family 4 [Lutibaculum baratangense AMV1]
MSEAQSLTREEAYALLAWYREAGVDEAVEAAPRDRLAPPPAPSTALEAAGIGPSDAPQASDPLLLAREQARLATTLEELRNILAGFEGCPLKYTAKNMCFADGNAEARIMFVGEAPGAEEDLQGKPFVGRAGRLLDRMLASIGLDRTSAYIANIVYWRPPGNRTPTPQEIQVCKPFIERQIELKAPEILVFLGGASAKEMMQRSDGILKMRGRWMEYRAGDRAIPAIATLHPAYLLRQPAQKRLAWRDLLSIRKALEGTR